MKIHYLLEIDFGVCSALWVYEWNYRVTNKDTVMQLICNTDSSYDSLIIHQYFVIGNCILINTGSNISSMLVNTVTINVLKK